MFGASTLTKTVGDKKASQDAKPKFAFTDIALLIYQKKKEKKILTEDEKAAIFKNKIEKLTTISVDE